jgi:hypothetical protein
MLTYAEPYTTSSRPHSISRPHLIQAPCFASARAQILTRGARGHAGAPASSSRTNRNEHFPDELLEIAALWQRFKGDGGGSRGDRGGGGASRSEGGLGLFDILLEYDRAEEERFVFVSQLTEVQRYVSMSPCICIYTYTYRICSELGLGQTSSCYDVLRHIMQRYLSPGMYVPTRAGRQV